jgi:hypothetical protein
MIFQQRWWVVVFVLTAVTYAPRAQEQGFEAGTKRT